jgi:hypothetical protein
MNIALFLTPASFQSNRDGWEVILRKVRTGEMPPKGIPRPPAEKIDALVSYVQGEFDRLDRNVKPDPGRVTAHRLNRNEYSNTVRDLLGVSFHADEEFPADDSGYGFDNVGAVLTVSPTLMQKYMSAAEQIASRAVGADPLPKPGFLNRKSRVRRVGPGAIELKDRVDFDAEYVVRALVTGSRGQNGKPVTLVLAVDGKPVKTVNVETAITLVNRQGGATQRTSEEIRVFLPQGDHVFRAAFVNDEALQEIPEKFRLMAARNIFPESFEIGGPYPPSQAHAAKRAFLVCDPAEGDACATRILAPLARRAYRRPVTKAEVAELARVFDLAKSKGYTPAQSLQFSIAAMLVSPRFLFRVEHDPKPGTVGHISDVELASRLSYFLWSSMPDEELLRLAETNRLHQPEVLDAQVKRLIADPKSSAFAENFAGQWLETRSLDAVKPDAKKFPEWTPELRDAMRTETSMFFEAVLRDNRPIRDFIDGKYTFVNELLARHYGIEGVTGPDFRRVELTGDQRSGVLTQASVLTVSSYPSRTSVVLRGKYVLENVLNAAPPPPPPDVPRLNEETVGVAKSLREQMEQHRSDPVCASCHSRMDVLGFGLENYDAIGRWRTQDGKFPIDASGSFPNGKSFAGPAGMKALLAENMPEFARCLAEKILTYSLGRGVEPFDRRTVEDIVRLSAARDYRFQNMILATVHSPAFLERRGETAPETKTKRAKDLEVASK